MPPTRRAALALSLGLAACAVTGTPPGPAIMTPKLGPQGFVTRDGAVLPARHWVPAGEVQRVVLALHGFNDSRDSWELPAPAMADAGCLVFAPDQRGFGAAPLRGLWAGMDTMVRDAADMAAALRATYPGLPLFLMGESMGGAVLMNLATGPEAPEVAGYVLLAPAVWGRARMNVLMRSSLWFASTFLPGVTASRPPPQIKIYPSDNPDAMRRLSTNPLTIKETRFDTLAGLVDLMDAAMALRLRATHDALRDGDPRRAELRETLAIIAVLRARCAAPGARGRDAIRLLVLLAAPPRLQGVWNWSRGGRGARMTATRPPSPAMRRGRCTPTSLSRPNAPAAAMTHAYIMAGT